MGNITKINNISKQGIGYFKDTICILLSDKAVLIYSSFLIDKVEISIRITEICVASAVGGLALTKLYNSEEAVTKEYFI